MYRWMKRLHTYAGLLSFTAFLVWGIAGIHAVFLPPPGAWQPPPVVGRREILYQAPGNLDDRALAQQLVALAAIPLASRPANIRRDNQHNVSFEVYTVNGRWDLSYQEQAHKLVIEERRNDLWDFLSAMHAGHSRRGPPHLATRLWGVYNEFSTWAFFFMVLSGAYLWLATRPGMRWAQVVAGGSAALFVLLWVVTR